MRVGKLWGLIGVAAICVGGCATQPDTRPQTVSGAESVLWSVDHPRKMQVNVSPAGRTLRIGGITGTIIGAGIDAAVNSGYRDDLEAALGDYDPGAVFEARISEALNETVPGELDQVPPLGSTTQYRNEREARDARYKNLGKRGADQVLDLDLVYGLYGPNGVVVAKIDGRLSLLPDGKRAWEGEIMAAPDPIVANMPLGDPSRTILAPNIRNPRLKAESDAVSQWTADGGAALQAAFDDAIAGAVSALVCDLGLAQEPQGEYYLGKLSLIRKEFDGAYEHFERALALDPQLTDARNGQAVSLALNDQLDAAIAMSEELVAMEPDYGPAWFNLAWWYGMEKDELDKARDAYAKARELGMPESDKLNEELAL